MNKKGDVFQVMFLLVLVSAVAFVGLLCLVLTTHINDFWDESGLLNESTTATESINTMQRLAPQTTDYTIFFLFIGLTLGTMIAAVRTNFSPVTLLLFIFLTFIAILEAAGFVNMYRGLADVSEVLPISEQLHWTNFIFSKYLPLTTCILCALVLLIMFSKSGGDIVS